MSAALGLAVIALIVYFVTKKKRDQDRAARVAAAAAQAQSLGVHHAGARARGEIERVRAGLFGPPSSAERAPHALPPGPPPPTQKVVERVVERQVVVTRCKYCGRLTAVHLDGCSECGAPF